MEHESTEELYKVEMVFDKEAVQLLEEMKNLANQKSTEALITTAIRVYDWYLRNRKNDLCMKQDGRLVKVDLKF